jgi:hypothetical protein
MVSMYGSLPKADYVSSSPLIVDSASGTLLGCSNKKLSYIMIVCPLEKNEAGSKYL